MPAIILAPTDPPIKSSSSTLCAESIIPGKPGLFSATVPLPGTGPQFTDCGGQYPTTGLPGLFFELVPGGNWHRLPQTVLNVVQVCTHALKLLPQVLMVVHVVPPLQPALLWQGVPEGVLARLTLSSSWPPKVV